MEYTIPMYSSDEGENLGVENLEDDTDSDSSEEHPTNLSKNRTSSNEDIPFGEKKRFNKEILNKQPSVPVLMKSGELEALAKKCSKSRIKKEDKIHRGHVVQQHMSIDRRIVNVKPVIHVEKHSFTRNFSSPVSGDKIYICHLCERIFLHRRQIIVHFKRHALERFHCELCRRGFVSKTTHSIHMKSHEERESHPCKLCGQLFTTSSGLSQHMKIHLNIREHACPFCPKKFVDSSSLQKHTDTHLGIRYGCDVCGKQYSARQTLRQHLAKHLGLDAPKPKRAYECSDCPRVFSSKHRLKVHRNKAHLQVVFACDVCSKVFASKNNLNVHKKVHTTQLTCMVCEKKYNSREGMLVHMNKHLDVTYPCQLCSKVYYLDRHLTDHVTRIHNFSTP